MIRETRLARNCKGEPVCMRTKAARALEPKRLPTRNFTRNPTKQQQKARVEKGGWRVEQPWVEERGKEASWERAFLEPKEEGGGRRRSERTSLVARIK